MYTPRLITAFALSLLLSPAVVLAQQETPQQSEHEAHHPETTVQQEEETTAEPADPAVAANATLTIMQQRMEEMLSHWDRMSQTTDPAKRQKLMLEHRQQMVALNTALRNMTQESGMGGPGRGMMGMGPGMMGNMMRGGKGQGMMGQMRGGMMGQDMDCPMMGKCPGMGRGKGSRMDYNSEGMMDAFQQLEKRVDLLQQMVEYLMQD